MTATSAIPLIVRGTLIETDLRDFGHFTAPAVERHLDRLLLADPTALRDVHELEVADIIDYLVELGEHLEVERNPHVARAVAASEAGAQYSGEILREMYRIFPVALRREVLEELVEHNIDPACLRGWVERELHDRRMAVRAFGARAVHVIAGNGPVIALRTVINNALARSDAIVKLPANDPYAATAIALTMIDMAPDHPLTKHLSVAYWKGGDRAVEQPLYTSGKLEKIIAWGGMASMRSIREYLGPGLDLVALDPKLSASVIGREAFLSEEAMTEAADRAAMDVGYYNQAACVSARVLYVESGTDPAGIDNANRFGERLFAAIQSLPAEFSGPHPAFDPTLRDEINGVRHGQDFTVFGGRGSEGAVIVSQDEEVVDFSDRLDCRVANVVPVDRVEDALRYLTIDTQTIGIYPDALKSRLRDECALRGGQRIISLGSATAHGLTGPHDAIQILPRMMRWIRDDTSNLRAAPLPGF